MSQKKQDLAHLNKTVQVSAPARLHLGFLDLNGTSGRKFGSIGLAINTHQTTVKAKLASSTSIEGISPQSNIYLKICSLIEKFYQSLGQHIKAEQQGVQITVEQYIPEHAGLGSGTQLALTIGTLLCRLHAIEASTTQIAAHLGRGARSGIGIATFDSGGFIVDGGLASQSTIPPLLAHYQLPPSWRIVMIMDHSHQGVHGKQELAAFKDLPTFPLVNSQTICHITLMKLLPALIEQDIDRFGESITQIQTLIGDHFAPAQGGRYTSDDVAELLNYAHNIGHTGIAQSSWGPTGCIFVENDLIADQLIRQLKHHVKINDKQSDLSYEIAQCNLDGAKFEVVSV